MRVRIDYWNDEAWCMDHPAPVLLVYCEDDTYSCPRCDR